MVLMVSTSPFVPSSLPTSFRRILSAWTILRYNLLSTISVVGRLLLRHQGLDIPDHIGILLDAPITREETHAAHTADALADPFVLILVCLVYQRLCLDVARKVVAYKVIIAIVGNGVTKSAEAI